MRYIYVECLKYRSSILLTGCLVLIISQLLFLVGLLTSFDGSFQMWRSVIEPSATPTFYFLFMVQRIFFYQYAIIVIALCGFIQYIEIQSNTWVLLMNLPVAIHKIFLAKLFLSLFLILVFSAAMVGMNYVAYCLAKVFLPLLKNSNIPQTLWWSWWLHFTAMLPIPLFLMHLLVILTKRRIGFFVIMSILTYITLSFMVLAPGILILKVKTKPLINYLDLFEATDTLFCNFLLIASIIPISKFLGSKLTQYISHQ